MKNTLNILLGVALLIGSWSCQSGGETTAPETTEPNANITYDASISLPDNFTAAVVADSVGRARHIAVRENGDVYVQLYRLKDEKGLVALRDTDGDVRADQMEYFGNYPGTGCAIYNGYLYSSSPDEIYRYELNDGTLLPDVASKTLIVGGFPDQQQHQQKSFTFDQNGHIYINVGGPSNACQQDARSAGSPGQDPCPQLERQASIWQFDADKPAQTQMKDGVQYARGIRNAVALDWNPATNNLFAMQHGRDQLATLWPGLFSNEESAELPAEEFLSIQEGDDFGWPYCYYNHMVGEKKLAPEYGGDGEQQGRCEGIKSPIMGFPAHMAPNDLLFYTGDQFPARYKNGAFIAFHGSWNRAPLPQKGYFVVFVPMENGQPSGEWEIFAEGFAGAEDIASPRDAEHRPCGLAMGPDGSLYVSDDVKGKIWKISFAG
ncbi:MAG TPA: PQQ-dependent sugar dehydrogenase [Saprospiraceae bacterium]|nr:PQQ-dependent sugar dehydrogenase [Saprospiraceae bacterium]